MTRPGRRFTDAAEGRSFLPLEYYMDFLGYLVARPDRYSLITYEDLAWQDEDHPSKRYPAEWIHWSRAHGAFNKIFVLIQHDLDAFPELTHAMLEAERTVGVRSSTMLFHRRLHRTRFEQEGVFEYTDYDVDFDHLRRLQDEGFVFGYHCNAYEQARFDARAAEAVFEDDIAALRERLDIAYCSGHGGLRDPAGKSNHIMTVPDSLAGDVRWVHNSISPRFDGAYSDGGFNLDLRHPDELDLRRQVRRWRPGGRYRVLIHPQYYESPPHCRAGAMVGAPWYDRVRLRYGSDEIDACEPIWPEGDARSGSPRPIAVRKLGRSVDRSLAFVGRAVHEALRPTRSLPPVDVDAEPIFVRAVSRSGGTLTVTVLDAHPDVAMSYELYPRMLTDPRRSWGEHFEYAEGPGPECGPPDMGAGERMVFQWKHLPWVNLVRVPRKVYHRVFPRNDEHTFLNNCMRSGVSRRRALRFLREHVRAGFGLSDAHASLRVIARVCEVKAERTGASRWGLKCSNQFEMYHDLWPNAVFINVIRDVRDVAASQRTVGAFDRNPHNIAAKWARTHRRFDEFVRSRRPRAHVLYYEDLVTDPERSLRELCKAAGLDFVAALTEFHRKDLSIYRAGHISLNRISKPIDASQIGRWKRDLRPEHVAEIEAAAGGVMKAHGYRVGTNGS